MRDGAVRCGPRPRHVGPRRGAGAGTGSSSACTPRPSGARPSAASWRAARAGSAPSPTGACASPATSLAARVDHGRAGAARHRAARRRGPEGQPRLRHDRHHHGAGDAARAGVALGGPDRDVRQRSRAPWRSATGRRWRTASPRSSSRPSPGRCRPSSPRCGPFCPEGKAVLIATVAKHVRSRRSSELLGGAGTVTLERPLTDTPGPDAALRIHLEPHHAADAESGPRASPTSSACSRTTSVLEKVAEMCALFPDELLGHCEFPSASVAASRRARCPSSATRRPSASTPSSRRTRRRA